MPLKCRRGSRPLRSGWRFSQTSDACARISWFVSDPVTDQINDVIAELSRLTARCLGGETSI
jgi:hypothetical protein